MKRTPFSIATAFALTWLCTTTPSAFNIAEHKVAGDKGAIAAFKNMEAKKPVMALPYKAPGTGRWVTRPGSKELAITLADGVKAFESSDILLWVGDMTGAGAGWATFGDLVSMYGDQKAGIDSMNGITESEMRKLQYNGRQGIDEMTINLLHLASMNSDHFSEHAVLSYRDRHKRALDDAKKAVVESDIRYLWRALHWEAYANHALTDLFAAGHLMLDRRSEASKAEAFYDDVMGVEGFLETMKAAARLTGVVSDGAIARVVHNCFNDGGIQTKTLEDKFENEDSYRKSMGDGHFNDNGHETRADMADAVEFSVSTVLQAYALMLEKADAAGSGSARTEAAEALYAKIGPNYYGALRKIPVSIRSPRCVIGGVTVKQGPAVWTHLPYRDTVISITKPKS
jgi:hypothetical protein